MLWALGGGLWAIAAWVITLKLGETSLNYNVPRRPLDPLGAGVLTTETILSKT